MKLTRTQLKQIIKEEIQKEDVDKPYDPTRGSDQESVVHIVFDSDNSVLAVFKNADDAKEYAYEYNNIDTRHDKIAARLKARVRIYTLQ